MKALFAICLAALVLGGCASEPTWNAEVFPPQPAYDTGGGLTKLADRPADKQ